MRRAFEHGNLSSLSVPLPVDDGIVGAINTYAPEVDAFDAEARAIAVRFAPYAAVAISNMQTYQHAREMADNLQVALETRAVIDQAKGILIERFKVTPDQAFQMLAQVSMRTNVKLRDIADGLVRTGDLVLRVDRSRGVPSPIGPTAAGRGDCSAAARTAAAAGGQALLPRERGAAGPPVSGGPRSRRRRASAAAGSGWPRSVSQPRNTRCSASAPTISPGAANARGYTRTARCCGPPSPPCEPTCGSNGDASSVSGS